MIGCDGRIPTHLCQSLAQGQTVVVRRAHLEYKRFAAGIGATIRNASLAAISAKGKSTISVRRTMKTK
jgi:hypothetical protein